MGQTILIVEDDKDLRENNLQHFTKRRFSDNRGPKWHTGSGQTSSICISGHSGHHDAWHFRH